MLGLTWWAWAGLGVLGFAILGFGARRSWRASVRRELVDYIGRTAPQIAVVAEHPDRLEVRIEERPDAGTFYLRRFYEQMVAAPTGDAPADRAAREAVYEVVVRSLQEAAAATEPTAEKDRARLRPRLVDDAALAGLRRAIASSGRLLPALPSGVAGLSIVLVLDSETTVAYVTDDILQALELTPEAALDVARANLGATFGREVVRAAVGSRDLNVIKSCDSFDAARLLLVAGYLDAGESLVALVPDRDTLVLTAPPADGDWSGLRKLARASAGDPLCADPLIVTAAGIARAA